MKVNDYSPYTRFQRHVFFACILIVGSIMPSLANAGAIYLIECEDAQGRQSNYRVPIGGGINHNQVTGYCHSRKGYVFHYWPSDQTPPPSTGSGEDLRFTVSDCPEPIKPIMSAKQLIYCPKDSGEVKRVHRKAMYD